MAYRNLMITNPARLSVRRQQLLIATDIERTVPIEDILTVMLENPQITITAATLSKLAEDGVLVFVCDEKHLPSAIFTPAYQHSRRLSVLQHQLAQSKPAQKQLWQQIICQKIANQARCLELLDKDAQPLHAMLPKVRSGDTTNVEATAAVYYFAALFGADFIRRDGSLVNGALNYGYSLLRGLVARALAIYGFEPSLGLHHHNALNAFNLADDLLEPFRPLVDLYVAGSEMFTMAEDDSLSPEMKQGLYQLLSMTVASGGERHAVHYAVERAVKSLSTCLMQGSGQLLLPELLPLALHSYE